MLQLDFNASVKKFNDKIAVDIHDTQTCTKHTTDYWNKLDQ